MINEMELKDIIKDAVTIRDTASFRDALSLMVKKQTNSLLVVDTEGVFIGVISVSDLLHAIVPGYLEGDTIAAKFASEELFDEAVMKAADKQVREFVNTNVQTRRITDSLMAVAETAIEQNSARVPIVDEADRPVGFVSRRGIKHILARQLGIEDSA